MWETNLKGLRSVITMPPNEAEESDTRGSISNVEVFRVDLTDPCLAPDHSRVLVAAAELQRADRLRRPLDRTRYLASHAALRLILSQSLGCAPQEIALDKGEFGKPTLPRSTHARYLEFNLSRSGDLALIALAECRPVGVDIERIEELRDLPLTYSHLAPPEAAAIAILEPAARLTAFFNCWVRKEAVLKAAGLGLSRGLNRIAVPVEAQDAGTTMTVLLPDGNLCQFFDLPVAFGYTACVAAPGVGWTPRLRDFVARQTE
jgi:4'-phosphopantetheinyl transferase